MISGVGELYSKLVLVTLVGRFRALFIHVSVPGQEPGAENLPGSFKFPKMQVCHVKQRQQHRTLKVFSQDLGLNLVSILDNLRIPRVIALGNGAGGNIITRLPSREKIKNEWLL